LLIDRAHRRTVYPRAQKMLAQYRLHYAGKVPLEHARRSAFQKLHQLGRRELRGATTNIWMWSGDTAPRTNLSRRADLPRKVARTLPNLAHQHLVPILRDPTK